MYNSYGNDLEMTWDVDTLFLEDPLQWLNVFNDCHNDHAVTVDLPGDGPSIYDTYNLPHLIETNLDQFKLSFLEDDVTNSTDSNCYISTCPDSDCCSDFATKVGDCVDCWSDFLIDADNCTDLNREKSFNHVENKEKICQI